MGNKNNSKYIERFLENKINKYLKNKEIIAVIGPRQCGKTTLIKHIFNKITSNKKSLFISFEDREILQLFNEDIKSFIETHIKNIDYLFIDEFQYSKEGGKQLKYIYDNFNTKIIISGSSAPDLTFQSIKYLVGRIFVLNLYPLSFAEFLKYKNQKLFNLLKKDNLSNSVIELIKPYSNEFLLYGGYPKVVLSEEKEEKEEILKNIYNTYFLREIKEILQISEDFKLNNLVNLLALQVGSLINYNELSSSINMNHLELTKSINILKNTFIIIETQPFFKNKKKEIIKTPKIFFLDNGFRNIILKNFNDLSKRTDIGEINENFIASELLKKNIIPKYWRTKSKAEVDFIIEEKGNIIPIEVKSNLKIPKITRSFRAFLEDYKPPIAIIYSENLSKIKKIKNTKILFRPLADIENF